MQINNIILTHYILCYVSYFYFGHMSVPGNHFGITLTSYILETNCTINFDTVSLQYSDSKQECLLHFNFNELSQNDELLDQKCNFDVNNFTFISTITR